VTGTVEGRRIAFLSRHGRGHRFLPAEINYRANAFGFKTLGVRRVISVSSVGSLREEVRPRDIVLADQFYDRTRRVNTFFGEGIVAHIGFARPVCPDLSRVLYNIGTALGLRMHPNGIYICIEGPAFSTIAESRAYRSLGFDVIGMTGATEAKLFREAEICYATLNLVTDYDVWRDNTESVSVDLIMENLRLNIDNAKALVRKAVAALPAEPGGACGCADALRGAIVSDPALVPKETKDRLRPLIGKYMP
jgi:5'-methylthioadenosine phosphorylase